ncbi:hypothetical protein HI972_004492 [Salmonella enterica]|nr:hypothetical protein [Salmonella enterica]
MNGKAFCLPGGNNILTFEERKNAVLSWQEVSEFFAKIIAYNALMISKAGCLPDITEMSAVNNVIKTHLFCDLRHGNTSQYGSVEQAYRQVSLSCSNNGNIRRQLFLPGLSYDRLIEP